jgi:hypothetical protein
VREGDHREREDHRGRTRSRVAWALEATVLTTASGTPGTLSSFPNLVVGLALTRPGIDPGGTATRVLRGARTRGFSPGPLGVDRAHSGAFAEVFHLPARAMGFSPVVDYRIDQLGRQVNSHGAVMVEGTWYCPSMPEVLVSVTRPTRQAHRRRCLPPAHRGARRLRPATQIRTRRRWLRALSLSRPGISSQGSLPSAVLVAVPTRTKNDPASR